MKAKGRIGVLMPLLSSVEDSNLLQGIQTAAESAGFDTILFTNSSNSQEADNETDNIIGEERVYSLVSSVKLDGILFCAGRFENPHVRERIADILKELTVPVVTIQWTESPFTSYVQPEKASIRAIVSHLTEVHGLRRIYCLTGPEEYFESADRAAGWREGLEEHGIVPGEDWLFYGDFWKVRARELAEDIAAGRVTMPEAVVCASDIMAVSLCEALKEHGISVPEQIAVTGFDGDMSAELSDPTVTTVGGRDIRLGENAVRTLISMMTGCPFEPEEECINLTLGRSCGCEKAERIAENSRYYDWVTDRSMFKEIYMNSNYEMDLFAAETLTELAVKISSYTYLIRGWQRFDVYIRQGKLDQSGGESVRTPDFSGKMELIMAQSRDGSYIAPMTVSTAELIGGLESPHEPVFAVVLPLHFNGDIFGYLAIRYGSGGDYFMDEQLLRLRNAVSNGLYFLRERLRSRYIAEQLERYSVREPVSGMYNQKGFLMQAESFLKDLRGKAGMMLISWSEESGSPSLSKLSLTFAHALQLQCAPDQLCGRLREKLFVMLFPLGEEPPEDFEAGLLFRLERTLGLIQNRRDGEFPELTAVTETVSAETYDDEYLDRLMKLLDRRMELRRKQHTNFTAELKALRRQIRITPENAVCTGEAARMLGISESHFARLYRGQFGISYNEDIIDSRLSKARKLLRDTDLTVKEIADRCGYANPSHFMRQFRSRMNMTAEEYRNK